MQEAQICLQEEGVASLQIIFNVLRQKAIASIFKQAQEKQVAIIVRLPLASGLLSGKLQRDTVFADNDHRNFNRDGQEFNVGETFSGLPFEKGLELVGSIKKIMPENQTLARSALRWILDFEAVSVVIPGSKNPRQVIDNCTASSSSPLALNTHKALSDLYFKEVACHIRGKY